MHTKFVKKGMLIALLIATIGAPVAELFAKDHIETITWNQQETWNDKNYWINIVANTQPKETLSIEILSQEEILFQDKLLNYIFVKTDGGHARVHAEPNENSEWNGKVFTDSVVKVIEKGETWSLIESGNVKGYVKTEDLITGKEVSFLVKEILTNAYPGRNIFTLSDEEISDCFSQGETKQEEEARLAAEKARLAAEEAARKEAQTKALRQKRQDVVNYAKRFIGNPYVYGGTSLSRGTDCSGLVKGVYAHFGVSLPRTSWEMRRSGYAVSVSDMQPGDIVCYYGHVGIYAGNGKMVNAVDEQKGIAMSNVNYKLIVSVRRIF